MIKTPEPASLRRRHGWSDGVFGNGLFERVDVERFMLSGRPGQIVQAQARKVASMKIFNLHHVNIQTSKLEETKDFYVQLLGLKVGPRPSFPTVGYFLYHGDDPIIHLLEDASQRQDDLSRANRIDHFGIMARGLEETRARLKAGNYKFKEARGVANDRLFRLFVEDPNGAVVELAFLMDATGKQEESDPPERWWFGCPLYS